MFCRIVLPPNTLKQNVNNSKVCIVQPDVLNMLFIAVINKAATGGTQVRALGSNVVQVAGSAVGGVKPVQMVGGKQTIVINKPGGGQQQIVTGGAGQQIIR